MPIISNEDALADRAQNLSDAGLNGISRILVDLVGDTARLEITLFNDLHRDALIAAASTPELLRQIFPISGGIRLRAGSAEGQVRATAALPGPNTHQILLRIEPIGDYSTYTLGIEGAGIDPVFSDLEFKFRPGCFTNDCSPEWEPGTAPSPIPKIDYLAKDFDSFRHLMMSGMMDRVPGWEATSEADLDQVLIDLFAAVGDELSDYQDRVMAESKLATLRSRISLARHARLMDYHVHQGNQASTVVALEINSGGQIALPANQKFWTGRQVAAGLNHALTDAHFFASSEATRLHPLFNTFQLYTWDDAFPALDAGCQSADLVINPAGTGLSEQEAADFVVVCVMDPDANHPPLKEIVLQQVLNSETGTANGVDPGCRQILRLVNAETIIDPLHGRTLVRVTWRREDELRGRYDFTVFPGNIRIPDASTFHGNLITVHHGRPSTTVFVEAGESKAHDNIQAFLGPGEILEKRHIKTYRRTRDNRYGVLAELSERPLSYRATPPGGEIPPVTTLAITVHLPGGGSDSWDEVINLVHSDDSEENGDHFAVETDELGRSFLRFGNGINGRLLPDRSVIVCRYQTGLGHEGNVGRDAIRNTEIAGLPLSTVTRCWNPFDVTNGREPELKEQVLRNAPEAFRARQLRAITLEDYIARAEEVEGVQRAHAAYRWTGSWRTVRITIDPFATTELSTELLNSVSEHLEAVRLVGEDLELRAPRFVPIAIFVVICVDPEVWPEDLRFVLEQEFSSSYTPTGRRGFFHPDHWTFGQRLRKSEVAGRLALISGVGHLQGIYWTRFNRPNPAVYDLTDTGPEEIFAGDDEIIMVENDPDHLEQGFIRFILKGGRR